MKTQMANKPTGDREIETFEERLLFRFLLRLGIFRKRSSWGMLLCIPMLMFGSFSNAQIDSIVTVTEKKICGKKVLIDTPCFEYYSKGVLISKKWGGNLFSEEKRNCWYDTEERFYYRNGILVENHSESQGRRMRTFYLYRDMIPGPQSELLQVIHSVYYNLCCDEAFIDSVPSTETYTYNKGKLMEKRFRASLDTRDEYYGYDDSGKLKSKMVVEAGRDRYNPSEPPKIEDYDTMMVNYVRTDTSEVSYFHHRKQDDGRTTTDTIFFDDRHRIVKKVSLCDANGMGCREITRYFYDTKGRLIKKEFSMMDKCTYVTEYFWKTIK
jgi:hypothetical protein